MSHVIENIDNATPAIHLLASPRILKINSRKEDKPKLSLLCRTQMPATIHDLAKNRVGFAMETAEARLHATLLSATGTFKAH